MLYINETPKGFKNTAKRDVYSDNTQIKNITTDDILRSANRIHKKFLEEGLYESIRNSDLYIHNKW
jgi:hypothetical protein